MVKMSKKKRGLDRYTWIITEPVIGLAALVYGLYATINSLPVLNAIYVIIASLGMLLLLIALTQILIGRRKKIKKYRVLLPLPKNLNIPFLRTNSIKSFPMNSQNKINSF